MNEGLPEEPLENKNLEVGIERPKPEVYKEIREEVLWLFGPNGLGYKNLTDFSVSKENNAQDFLDLKILPEVISIQKKVIYEKRKTIWEDMKPLLVARFPETLEMRTLDEAFIAIRLNWSKEYKVRKNKKAKDYSDEETAKELQDFYTNFAGPKSPTNEFRKNTEGTYSKEILVPLYLKLVNALRTIKLKIAHDFGMSAVDGKSLQFEFIPRRLKKTTSNGLLSAEEEEEKVLKHLRETKESAQKLFREKFGEEPVSPYFTIEFYQSPRDEYSLIIDVSKEYKKKSENTADSTEK